MIDIYLAAAVIIERTKAHRPRRSARSKKNIASYRTCESGLEWLRPTPATRLRDQKIGLAAYRAATARDEIYGGPDHCDRVGNDRMGL